MRNARSGWACLALTVGVLSLASPAWATGAAVPAPPALALVAVGAVGLAGWALWRRRK
jgi:hypothetical protein